GDAWKDHAGERRNPLPAGSTSSTPRALENTVASDSAPPCGRAVAVICGLVPGCETREPGRTGRRGPRFSDVKYYAARVGFSCAAQQDSTAGGARNRTRHHWRDRGADFTFLSPFQLNISLCPVAPSNPFHPHAR